MIIPRHGCAMFRLTRAQRREMQKLAARVDRVTQADRLFFARFPHRQYRGRLTRRAEITRQELIERPPDDDPARLPAVRGRPQYRPGCPLVFIFADLEGAETDLDETTARAIFEWRPGP